MPTSVIPPNRAKRLLKEGRSLIGTFVVEFRQAVVMQFISNAGFDFVLLDNEHGAFSNESIAELSRAAVLLGLTPIVRIPEISYPYLAQTLDIGAQGIMVPRINNVDQVRDVVRMIRYPPLGERGNAQERGLTQFKAGPLEEVLASVHQETMLIVQLETRSALESIEQIVDVEGVDAVLVGPNDLSISLGVPGKMDHPLMREAIRRTIKACQAYNVTPAIHISNLELAAYWAGQGMRMISTGSEAGFIMRGGRDAIAAIQKGWQA